jgi:hypothetical protein
VTDWNSFYNVPRRPPNCGKCDVCGRKDETVKWVVYIRDYDPDAPKPDVLEPVEWQRCPCLCASCLADEPSSEDLARKAIG